MSKKPTAKETEEAIVKIDKEKALQNASEVKQTLATPGWKIIDGIIMGHIRDLGNIMTISDSGDVRGRQFAVNHLTKLRQGLNGIVEALETAARTEESKDDTIRVKTK